MITVNHNDDNSELNQTAPPQFRSTAPVCVSTPAFTLTIMMKRLVIAILKKIEIRTCQNKIVHIYRADLQPKPNDDEFRFLPQSPALIPPEGAPKHTNMCSANRVITSLKANCVITSLKAQTWHP